MSEDKQVSLSRELCNKTLELFESKIKTSSEKLASIIAQFSTLEKHLEGKFIFFEKTLTERHRIALEHVKTLRGDIEAIRNKLEVFSSFIDIFTEKEDSLINTDSEMKADIAQYKIDHQKKHTDLKLLLEKFNDKFDRRAELIFTRISDSEGRTNKLIWSLVITCMMIGGGLLASNPKRILSLFSGG